MPSSPESSPLELAPDESALAAIQRVQDQFQQMLSLVQRRSHKTITERATSYSKGNADYAAIEEVISEREWQEQAKLAYDQKYAEAAEAEETYHNAVRRTLETTIELERQVKTVTMRADSLAHTEADFFQLLITRQEESIRALDTLHGQLCQPRSTTWHLASHRPKLVPP